MLFGRVIIRFRRFDALFLLVAADRYSAEPQPHGR
jgi:hypothetical protein